MFYDLSEPFQRKQFLARAAHLAEKGGTAELTARRPKTTSQNSYVHSIIAYFALKYGETAEWVKTNIFKAINADVFTIWRENELRGRYSTYRSTSTLTSEEMSLCIDRFRDYSSKEFGLYLPSPDDYQAMQQIEVEINRNRQYL